MYEILYNCYSVKLTCFKKIIISVKLGLLIKTLQKIEVGTGTFAESCNANAHDARKYCFYKIVCSVMQSDKHC